MDSKQTSEFLDAQICNGCSMIDYYAEIGQQVRSFCICEIKPANFIMHYNNMENFHFELSDINPDERDLIWKQHLKIKNWIQFNLKLHLTEEDLCLRGWDDDNGEQCYCTNCIFHVAPPNTPHHAHNEEYDEYGPYFCGCGRSICIDCLSPIEPGDRKDEDADEDDDREERYALWREVMNGQTC